MEISQSKQMLHCRRVAQRQVLSGTFSNSSHVTVTVGWHISHLVVLTRECEDVDL